MANQLDRQALLIGMVFDSDKTGPIRNNLTIGRGPIDRILVDSGGAGPTKIMDSDGAGPIKIPDSGDTGDTEISLKIGQSRINRGTRMQSGEGVH